MTHPFQDLSDCDFARTLLRHAQKIIREDRESYICLALSKALARISRPAQPSALHSAICEDLKFWIDELLGGDHLYTSWIETKHPKLWHAAVDAGCAEQLAKEGRIRWINWMCEELKDRRN